MKPEEDRKGPIDSFDDGPHPVGSESTAKCLQRFFATDAGHAGPNKSSQEHPKAIANFLTIST